MSNLNPHKLCKWVWLWPWTFKCCRTELQWQITGNSAASSVK